MLELSPCPYLGPTLLLSVELERSPSEAAEESLRRSSQYRSSPQRIVQHQLYIEGVVEVHVDLQVVDLDVLHVAQADGEAVGGIHGAGVHDMGIILIWN